MLLVYSHTWSKLVWNCESKNAFMRYFKNLLSQVFFKWNWTCYSLNNKNLKKILCDPFLWQIITWWRDISNMIWPVKEIYKHDKIIISQNKSTVTFSIIYDNFALPIACLPLQLGENSSIRLPHYHFVPTGSLTDVNLEIHFNNIYHISLAVT